MSYSLTPQQTLFLWYLIGKGGSWLGDIKPELSARDRAKLETSGLITIEKRNRDAKSSHSPASKRSKRSQAVTSARKRRVKASWVDATDAGWSWANDHLSSPLPAKTQSAGPILHAWLTHLGSFLRQRGLALADVIAVKGEQSSKVTDSGSSVVLEDRIRRAYLDASGGTWNQRVHLSELRRRLEGVARDVLDSALLKMQQASKLVLFRLDNQREITDADRQAALIIGGEPRHVMRMGG
jgi:hypothetical protein